MEVSNIMEKLVWENMDTVLERNPGACGCDKCRADIVAFTLNNMPPRYVVTEKGAILARAQSLDANFKIELLIALAEAVKMISAHPRHGHE